ncbi:hypothetical protein CC78DRAFT_356917 [Lojkania enalia]|uniref:Uncharacterized protein n=1 Tax=Lojkania enalia TaxID=147567 RepID=A0A9P4K3D7_9PLEO|nr:hypothetical protein CC78DRAFT_356917 [Didymosphaeria enalia]
MKLLSLLSLTATAAMAQSSAEQPNFGFNKLYELQQGFWEKFAYPNNVKEAESINSTIFAENVLGRVSDTRNFEGRELNTEYIFALFTPSEAAGIVGRPGKARIVSFLGQQNIASASTVVNFTFPQFRNLSLPVWIDTWITWNEKEEISQYDAVFRWFGNLVQTLIGTIDPDPEKAAAKAQDMVATSVCNTHQKYCNGTNTQYDDYNDCYHFLTKEIRMGQVFESGMNTLMCRSIHEIMVKSRPSVHCPHIGKTGGGMCDDLTSYKARVEQDYFTNAPWIPTAL